ncbi:MAG: superoxide dismutase family protein [Balneolaceae bacterium]
MKYYLTVSITMLFAFFLVQGCAQEGAEEMPEPQVQTDFTKAVVVLHPTEDNEVSGTVTFEQDDEGVRVVADLEGMNENSNHGFHIHQYGDCTAEDGTSAGGHFNPTDSEHGAPDDMSRHVGDLGNLETDGEGNATADFVDPMLTLNGPNSIIGRGVIIHSGEDDFETQPTGDAGSRLACGVIGVENTESNFQPQIYTDEHR